MKVFATYNIKGGVGKTAAAVNLAWLAAHEGARTLVWDLDPQGATGYYFRVGPRDKVGTRALVRGKHGLDGLIRATDHEYLDLLPASLSYRHMDLALDGAKKPTKRISRLIEPLAVDYEWLFLDCPPSLSLVSENVFNAADALLVPVIPTTLSVLALDQVLEFLAESQWRKLRVLPFFSMVDRRKRLHRDMVEDLPAARPALLRNWVAYSADVERMGQYQAPVSVFAPRSPAALAYAEIWREIKERLQLAPAAHNGTRLPAGPDDSGSGEVAVADGSGLPEVDLRLQGVHDASAEVDAGAPLGAAQAFAP